MAVSPDFNPGFIEDLINGPTYKVRRTSSNSTKPEGRTSSKR